MRDLPAALAQSLPSIAEIEAELAGKVEALRVTKTPEGSD